MTRPVLATQEVDQPQPPPLPLQLELVLPPPSALATLGAAVKNSAAASARPVNSQRVRREMIVM